MNEILIRKRPSWVAIEGNGFIEPSFHLNDSDLMFQLHQGFNVINLLYWNEPEQSATFILSKAPLNTTGAPLRDGVSAAVKADDINFPIGRWVKIEVDGKFFGYRLIDDECSSCGERHIDLYYSDTKNTPDIPEGPGATAQLMDVGFEPSNLGI